jgi:hypothetical protein
VAKKPYLDHSLCFVDVRKHNHGSMISGFRYALGFGLSKELKFRIAQMHAFGLSPTQILQQYTKEIRQLALSNEVVTRNTFLLPSNVRDNCRKWVKELCEKIALIPSLFKCGQSRIHIKFLLPKTLPNGP